ncbi:recombinase RecA [Paucibacter sp. APW11]|uniref:Recombinase RecA n=1 Tax=Roseateles aquae TaxID=3077235 RepID=A0ABU3PDY4_9BURK|nr:recombinase RecA [Paucibacter sp. APW11]MDT9000337.1 recombinase RecA [Paucibacter sp. APW11]
MLAAPAHVATAAASPEALLADPRLWRATSLGASSSPCVASGFAALDAELPGGGWPTRMLSEILQPEPGLCEWRLLGPALGRLLQAPSAGAIGTAGAGRRRSAPAAQTRQLLLIKPPRQPHLPGLRALGIAPQQLVWIDPADALQALWVTEQAIKANAAAAILAWLPTARPPQIRRLQAAALASAAPVFLFRPLAAQAQSSAAPLRLLLHPGADWTLQLQILKRRGPAHAGALQLSALPAELAALLAPRLLRPSAPVPHHEVHHEPAVLARPARARRQPSLA